MDNAPEVKKQKKPRSNKAYRIYFMISSILAIASLTGMAIFSETSTTKEFVCAILFGIWGLWSVIFYVIMKSAEEQKRNKESEDMAKVLQAMFELTRKSQADSEKKMQEMSDSYAVPAEEIINAIKALAKVTIGRTKENAEALMNSNSLLAGKIADMQSEIEKLSGGSNNATETNQESKAPHFESGASDDQIRKLSNSIDDVLHVLKRMDDDIERLEQSQKALMEKPPVIFAGSLVSGTMPQQNAYAAQPVQQEPEYKSSNADIDDIEEPGTDDNENDLGLDIDADSSDESLESEEASDDELSLDSETMDTDLNLESDTDEENPELDAEEPDDSLNLDAEETDDSLNLDAEEPDDQLNLDSDISADSDLELDTGAREDVGLDVDSSLNEEPEAEPEPEQEEEPQPEPEPTPQPAPEAKVEPISNDPNAKLSPDQIAALFASANAGSSTETEEPAVEPEPEPEPVQQPAPASDNNSDSTADESNSDSQSDTTEAPKPEVSGDPNRMMTPEEIEALFSKVK
jgi:hypothetical protein